MLPHSHTGASDLYGLLIAYYALIRPLITLVPGHPLHSIPAAHYGAFRAILSMR